MRRRLGLLGGLVLLLAGCFESAPLAGFSGRNTAPGPTSLPVLGGQVTIAGPSGYCVDTSSVRENGSQVFVFLLRCQAAPRPAPVLSATVTAVEAPVGGGQGALEGLAGFIASDTGRAQLSRTGRAEDVAIEGAQVDDGAIWLTIRDSGNPEAFDAGYWRAILPIADRIVTLSVLSSRRHPAGAELGLTTLRGFVREMRAANQ
ncbi:hypothetical protein [Pararhodobacter sp. SW119]|uniref:hypothetical protein n=1 Tax=Pararhodobacter sp. SW119 TaxID=2780075 RepID=UPI001ADEEEDD|nr:hypothetical protein [Pararhodobacter sp. SW119]